jgi:hypothetical protein
LAVVLRDLVESSVPVVIQRPRDGAGDIVEFIAVHQPTPEHLAEVLRVRSTTHQRAPDRSVAVGEHD